jgi:hypothetical protein
VPPRRRTSPEPLFGLPAGRKGRVEAALDKAIAAARQAGNLSDVDGAAITLARAQARGVDAAEGGRNPWALAALGRELRETLIRLRMDPVSRGGNRESIAEFLAALGRPTPGEPSSGDGAGPAVGDPEDT